jgi:hypothetical protein
MNYNGMGGLLNNSGSPCSGHLLSKLSHVNCVSCQTLRRNKGKGVLGNSEGTRETQVNLFLSLKLT